jgi:hypothetical protein
MYFPKSLMAKILCGLALFSSITSVDAFDQPTGVAVRIQQRTVEQWKIAMQRFLPHFITYDMHLKETEHWDLKLLFGLLTYHFKWTDIRYEQPTMDMVDTKINFVNKFDKQMLKVDFPTFKYWKIEANQHVDFMLLPQDSVIVAEFHDFDVKFNCEFERIGAGFLKPVIYATELNWGETRFYHEDWFLSMLFFQVIKFMQVIIKNSIYFLGDYIFSGMLEPTLTSVMNQY